MTKFVIAVCMLTVAIAHAGAPVHWLNPVNGDWEDATAWAEGRVPGLAGDQPTLGLYGAYTVYSGTNTGYESLFVTNPDASLRISGAHHSLIGNIGNSGRIILGDAIFPSNSSLILNGLNRIHGQGVIELESSDLLNPARLDATFSFLTHDFGHSIIGSGELRVTSITNNGTIEATGDAGLRLFGTYSQSESGSIGARASTLFLSEFTTLSGGLLYTEGQGEVLLEGSTAELQNITSNSTISTTPGAHELSLRGDIINNGRVIIDATSDHETRSLLLRNGTTISGNGTIELIASGDPSEASMEIEREGTVSINDGQIIKASGLIAGLNQSLILLDGVITSMPQHDPPSIRSPIRGSGRLIADQTDISLRSPTILSEITLQSLNGGEFVLAQGTTRLVECINETTIRFDMFNSTLQIQESLVNNGQIIIDATNTNGQVRLHGVNESTISGNGSIELISREVESATLASTAQTLTIGPEQHVFGHGTVQGSPNTGEVINQGTIRANFPSYPLTLRGNHRGDGGVYIADNAQLLLDYPVTLNSVVLSSVGTGEIIAEGCTFISCTNESDMTRIKSSSIDTRFEGHMVNNGQIALQVSTKLILAGDSTLSGNGSIVLEPGSELQLGTFSYLNEPYIHKGQQIIGSGIIRGRATFESDIIANHPTGNLYILGNLTFVNGSIISDGGSVIFESSSIVRGATLQGDNFVVDRVLELDNSTIETQLDVIRDLLLRNGSLNNGTIRLRSSEYQEEYSVLMIEETDPIEGTGVIELENQIGRRLNSTQIRSVVNQTVRIGHGQKIIGRGQILGRVVIEGELAPSGPLAEIQVMDLVLDEAATLTAAVGADTDGQHAPISILPAGNIELNGTLHVDFGPGFTGAPGSVWKIIGPSTPKVPGTITGQFDSIELPHSPSGLRFMIEQTDNCLQLVVACTADLNGDSDLNFLDVSLFIQLFQSQDPLSDLNEDGQFNFLDVSSFIQALSEGCPS